MDHAERIIQRTGLRGEKFWSLYVKESEQHDKNATETWKTNMDSTLIFTDSSDETRDLLKQILAIQIVEAFLINVLWFLSLSQCSPATALSVTLVQQWIRNYLQESEKSNQPQRRATIRGIMFYGTGQWKLNSISDYIYIPTLLHLSILL
ncbi:hypothetical protein E4T56_gene6361 [Termitomyces sp. T112]|nr:hypothetical protein E4T56_gene6361 [Termitomyces sp. T112]